jgi:hypothetical protein
MASRESFYDWFYALKKGDLVLDERRIKGVVWHVKDNPSFPKGNQKSRVVQVKLDTVCMKTYNGKIRELRNVQGAWSNPGSIWPYASHLDCVNDVPFPRRLFHEAIRTRNSLELHPLFRELSRKYRFRVIYNVGAKRDTDYFVRSDFIVPLCLDLYDRMFQ